MAVDRARMKTFVLLLLLVVNLTFLGLIITDRLQAARLESEAKEELIQVLQNLGVAISYEGIPPTEEQAIYLLPRDIEAERQVTARILEGPEERDEGGGIYHYFSHLGSAQFRAGSFRFDFAGQGISAAEGMQEIGDRMLERLELQGEISFQSGDEREGRLAYTLTVEGLTALGGQVVFFFSEGYLREITGPSLWGQRQRYIAEEQLDVTTALVRLAGRMYEGAISTRFVSVQMGYYFLEGSGYLEFRPVWIIETEDGTFSVDRQSGEIR